MNNKERIYRIFRNEPVDRIPVGFWHHYVKSAGFLQLIFGFYLKLDDANALKDPSILEDNLNGHIEFINAFKPDLVKMMSDGF
jgi:uroporphyrinogen decarboxylase